MKKGWHYDSARHSLARKGIESGRKTKLKTIKTKYELIDIQPVKKFNANAMQRWEEAVDEWHENEHGGGMPYVGMYVYYTPTGAERKTGYVLIYKIGGHPNTGSILRSTKKELLEEFDKMQKRGY